VLAPCCVLQGATAWSSYLSDPSLTRTLSRSLTTDYHQRLTAWNGISILPPFFHFWKNVSGFLSKQMPLCVVLSNQCYDGSPNNSWWCFCLYLIAPWWPSSCSFSILFAACLIWAFFFADDHFGSFWTKWWGSSCNFLLLSPLVMIVGCPDDLVLS